MIDEMMAAIDVTPITSIVSAHAAKPTMCDANTMKPNGFDLISGGKMLRHTGEKAMQTETRNPAVLDRFPCFADAFHRRTALRNIAIELYDRLHPRGGPERRLSFEERRQEDRANAEAERAYQAAADAIGSEILPAITGRHWRKPKRSPSFYWRSAASQHGWPLLDHTLFFTTDRGSCWGKTIIVSQPYDVFYRDGRATPSAIGQARELQHGLIAWGAPDVGPWYPDSTALVLVSPVLRGLDAARWGFVDLAGERSIAGSETCS